MTKSQLIQARAELRALTVQLRAGGIAKLAYLEDSIDSYPPSTLRSCLAWARETLAHIGA